MEAATSLLDLPNEILLQIQSYLWLPDGLQQLSQTNQRLRYVCNPRAQHHLHARAKYRHLNQGNFKWAWVEPTVDILRDRTGVIAHYVESIYIPISEWYWRDLPGWHDSLPKPPVEDLDLISQAAIQSPWIHECDACGVRAAAKNLKHFQREIYEGDQDNICAILVPLLPNLKKICLPAGEHGGLQMGSLPGVVERIAKEAGRRLALLEGSKDNTEDHSTVQELLATPAHLLTDAPLPRPSHLPQALPDDLPLSKLHEVVGLTYNAAIEAHMTDDEENAQRIRSHPMGLSIEGLLPFIAIPSVKKLTASCVREVMRPVNLDQELPLSRLQSVRFEDSTIDENAARELARHIKGPCRIVNARPLGFRMTQITLPGRSMPEQPWQGTWTSLEIPWEGAEQDDCIMIGQNTFHPWTDGTRRRIATSPPSITAPPMAGAWPDEEDAEDDDDDDEDSDVEMDEDSDSEESDD